jgi:hypothetical protein
LLIKNETQIALTFDTDWCPDWILEELIEILISRSIKSTFFCTNKSSVLNELVADENFELGIHPNFSHSSTHGGHPYEILESLMNNFPNAIGYRGHSLHNSSRIIKVAKELGLLYDSNIFVESSQRVLPFFDCNGLYRFTHHYSDAARMLQRDNKFINDFDVKYNHLNIFDFHPIHLWIGADNFLSYNDIKKDFIYLNKNLNDCSRADLAKYRVSKNWPLLSNFFKTIENKTLYKLAELVPKDFEVLNDSI